MSRTRNGPLLTLISAATCILCVGAPPARADWSFIRGDCNSDSFYDISDPIALLDELFITDEPAGPCADACDANDDGTKDIADAIFMLEGMFGEGELPPEPFGACGVDPTDDALGCDGSFSGCPSEPPEELALLEPPRPSTGAPRRRGAPERRRPGEDADSPTQGVNPFSGELDLEFIDLRIPGRGLDFVWSRSYRSRFPTDGLIGENWDFSYNIYIEQVAGGLLLHDGRGRADLFTGDAQGIYAANGHFHTGSFDGADVFTVAFPNHGKWVFDPLPSMGALTARISMIEDRNGNAITFEYDGDGRLDTITDTLGRVIEVSWNALGKISAVTDFSGRTVTYEYHDGLGAGGGLGDLASMTTPVVVATPTGNDYPAGKTTSYTYSFGFADDRLNHNLLRIFSAKGQLVLDTVYAATLNDADLEFDRVVRQYIGTSGVPIDTAYEQAGSNLLVIFNDRRGLITEHTYDPGNRCIMTREYTGFADPMLPTTSAANRPGFRLRASDPTYFETLYAWNADSLPVQVTTPNGTQTLSTYEMDLDPLASRHERGNLRLFRRIPGSHLPPGAQGELIDSYEYLAGFGGAEAADFLTRHVDPRGGETLHTYDASGNRIHTTHAVPSVEEDWEYNAFGQLTAHVHPNAAAPPQVQRRRDEFSYHATGPQTGYLAATSLDALGLALTTQYTYDAPGNIATMVDAEGRQTDFVRNALNQVVRVLSPEVMPGVRHERNLYYDANDNLARVDVQRVDEDGIVDPVDAYVTTIYDYDALDHLIRVTRERSSYVVPLSPPQLTSVGLPLGDFVLNGYIYDVNEQLQELRYGEAMNGGQSGNIRTYLYDERDLLYRMTRGAGADASTDQFDYDGNGNLTRRVDGIGPTQRTADFVYDGYDRLVQSIDAMGNVAEFIRDGNGNPTRTIIFGELIDVTGATGNLRLHEALYEYDALDREVLGAVKFFRPASQAPFLDGESTTEIVYNDNSQPLTVTDDVGSSTSYHYDTANRLESTTDALGNVTALTYDTVSNLTSRVHTELPTAGGPAEEISETLTYDALDRLTSHSDGLGNTMTYRYDSRDNLVETVDALGNLVTRSYDSLDRPLVTRRYMTDTGTGGGNPVDPPIITARLWDDSSRIVGRIDPNGNTTEHAYDALSRLVSTTYADGTVRVRDHDVHDNIVYQLDANGSEVFYGYDLLDRNVIRDISPGPDVSADTTYELYDYDGLSRLVRAEDDDSEVLREWDSLSGNILEIWVGGAAVGRSYNGVGRATEILYPGGLTLTLTRDQLQRKKIVSGGGVSASYEFVGPGRVVSRAHGNDTRLTVQYDGARRVSATSHVFDPGGTDVVVDSRSYSWDAMGNKISRQDTRPGGPGWTHDYAYDSAYRLVETHVADGLAIPVRDSLYSLDHAGNRMTVSDDSCNGTYFMSPTLPAPADFQMNQYTTTGCDSRQYDENGNSKAIGVIGTPGIVRQYDYRNQLVAELDGGSGLGIVEYSYDPLGRRIARSIPVTGELTSFVYDGWQLIEEQDAGTTLASFVQGNAADEIIARIEPGGPTVVTYYHADDVGNVMALTDASGNAVERYEYADYGLPSFLDGAGDPLPQSAVGNDMLFQGRRLEPNGLYHFRTRELDPLAGRFLSRDSIGIWGDPAGLGNGFTFAANNPWTLRDPTGQAVEVPRSVAGFEHPLARVGFNPQPEPPPALVTGLGLGVPGSEVSFNPQPEPPPLLLGLGLAAPGSRVGFNPQPEPPPAVVAGLGLGVPGSEVSFNPQPEPPPLLLGLGLAAPGSRVGFNPQPEPPPGLLAAPGLGVPGSAVSFNPQPEPPPLLLGLGFAAPGSLVGFNPQPEPPPSSAAGFLSPATLKGFNPQPEPPGKEQLLGGLGAGF